MAFDKNTATLSLTGAVDIQEPERFPAGTIVQLKGGSPSLTSIGRFVPPPNMPQALAKVKRTSCVWFHEGAVGEAAFPEEALMLWTSTGED